MELRRGDIVVIAARGPYTSKPLPAVVIQSDAYNPCHDSVTVCPLTTTVVESPRFRVAIHADAGSNLETPSQAMVDKVLTLPLSRMRQTGGRVNDSELTSIDDTLRHWLDL